jgi:hypothetical protein
MLGRLDPHFCAGAGGAYALVRQRYGQRRQAAPASGKPETPTAGIDKEASDDLTTPGGTRRAQLPAGTGPSRPARVSGRQHDCAGSPRRPHEHPIQVAAPDQNGCLMDSLFRPRIGPSHLRDGAGKQFHGLQPIAKAASVQQHPGVTGQAFEPARRGRTVDQHDAIPVFRQPGCRDRASRTTTHHADVGDKRPVGALAHSSIKKSGRRSDRFA